MNYRRAIIIAVCGLMASALCCAVELYFFDGKLFDPPATQATHANNSELRRDPAAALPSDVKVSPKVEISPAAGATTNASTTTSAGTATPANTKNKKKSKVGAKEKSGATARVNSNANAQTFALEENKISETKPPKSAAEAIAPVASENLAEPAPVPFTQEAQAQPAISQTESPPTGPESESESELEQQPSPMIGPMQASDLTPEQKLELEEELAPPPPAPVAEAPMLMEEAAEEQLEMQGESSVGFFRLSGKQKSNGSSGMIASQARPGFAMKRVIAWSEKFSNEILGSLDFKSGKQASARKLDHHRLTLTNFGIGAKWRMSNGFYAGPRIYYGQELLYQAVNTHTLRLNAVEAVSAGINLNAVVAKRRKTAFLIEAEVGGIAPIYDPPYKTNTGFYWSVKPSFAFRHKTWVFTMGVGYEQRSISSTVIDYRLQNMKASAGLIWTFGGEK